MRLRPRYFAYVAIAGMLYFVQYHFNLGAKELIIEVVSIERRPNDERELRLDLVSDVDPRSLPYYSKISNMYLNCAEDGPAKSMGISNFPQEHDLDGYWKDGKYHFTVFIMFRGPRVSALDDGGIVALADVPPLLGEGGCIPCEYVFAFFPRGIRRNISSRPFCLPVPWILNAIEERSQK